ncbi:MAG: hypothetical protein IKS55_15380 [Oscillospiraceae bacterium]|nr:hypothetical protein [Oscillospiraceae bacterium]
MKLCDKQHKDVKSKKEAVEAEEVVEEAKMALSDDDMEKVAGGIGGQIKSGLISKDPG